MCSPFPAEYDSDLHRLGASLPAGQRPAHDDRAPDVCGRPKKHCLHPYFYAGVEASDPTFSGDSALYAMTSRSALYTFYTPGAGYIDNPPHIIASMSPYDDEALDRYRSVDGGVAALLLDYFADGIAALDALPSESARIEALAELVRECAAYNANVGAYPQDVDFVRYFLTESGEGRCVHFATTATLLYRSLGYPARFVSGYSAVVEKTTTLVPDYAAHAWTEIWIDGLGWIPVDVTPAEYRGAGFGDVSQTESAQTSAGAESGAFVRRLLFEFSRKRYEQLRRTLRPPHPHRRPAKAAVRKRRPSFRSLPRREPALGSSC